MRAKGFKEIKNKSSVGKWIKRYFEKRTSRRFRFEEIQCSVCGYYCLGNGGFGCMDKPKFVTNRVAKDKEVK